MTAPAPTNQAFTPIRRVPLGRMLIDRNLIEQEDLDRALELQRERGDKIGKILVDMGTLANRDMMVYRMLLGRQAIPRDGLVKPSASFLQPRLHYRVYEQGGR